MEENSIFIQGICNPDKEPDVPSQVFHSTNSRPSSLSRHGPGRPFFHAQTLASQALAASFSLLGTGIGVRWGTKCMHSVKYQAGCLRDRQKIKNKKVLKIQIKRGSSEGCYHNTVCVCVCMSKLVPSSAHYSHPTASPALCLFFLRTADTFQMNSFASHVAAQQILGICFWERSRQD